MFSYALSGSRALDSHSGANVVRSPVRSSAIRSRSLHGYETGLPRALSHQWQCPVIGPSPLRISSQRRSLPRWQSTCAWNRPARPGVDPVILATEISAAFGGDSPVDQLCDDRLNAARERGITVDGEDGEILDDIIQIIMPVITAAFWSALPRAPHHRQRQFLHPPQAHALLREHGRRLGRRLTVSALPAYSAPANEAA